MSNIDTIAAIATPPGAGGIGIIRLTGRDALSIGQDLTRSSLQPGKIQYRQFYDADQKTIDFGIALFFSSPNSFTGEDVVELQGHGGKVLQEILLQRVCDLGARLANPGEYSERAFNNNKLDLTQAEAIADLIESGSQAAARAAMRSLQGEFSRRVHALVKEVVNLRTFVEASLDFSEEEIDFLTEADLQKKIKKIIKQNQKLLKQAENGQILNEGMTLAIAGLPNAGKSSLLNYLAGYDAAIVTHIAGTTRDVIREHITIKGIPLNVVDTAGLRNSTDPIEQEGIKRAWNEVKRADVVLLLIDATKGLSGEDEKILTTLQRVHVKQLFTKVDLLSKEQKKSIKGATISTKTGEGMESLINDITHDYQYDPSVFIARKRHIEALRNARLYLKKGKQIFKNGASGELFAEDLRQAQNYLNQITGAFTTEDLLGKIFSGFCVGK